MTIAGLLQRESYPRYNLQRLFDTLAHSFMAPAITTAAPPVEVPALCGLVGASYVSLPALLAARVAATPDAPFVVDRNRSWSFARLEARARSFASYLRASFEPGVRVAMLLPHSVEGVVAMLGTHLAGGCFVALNHQLKGALLADQLARSRARLLVTDAEAIASRHELRTASLETLVSVGSEVTNAVPLAAIESTGRVVSLPEVAPATLASVMFTSGTTGRSKAVRISHAYLCRGASRVVEGFGLGPDDVVHHWFPLSHVGGQMHGVACALVSGASLAMYPTYSASRFWTEVASSGATLIGGFQSVARILLAGPDPSSPVRLRLALLAGVTASEHVAFERRFGGRVVQAYGMTEAEPLSVTDVRRSEPPGSLGRPTPDFEVAIVDATGRRLPPGALGRIVVRPRAAGAMMDGYEDVEGVSSGLDADGWFATQDLGRQDSDGYLYFGDRLKHAIRRRGENISSVELEGVISKHPRVALCAAIAVPSPLGEHDIKLVVVPAPGPPLSLPEFYAWCIEALPRYMVPRYYELRDSLPVTELGKVQRESLSLLGDAVWDAEGAASSSKVCSRSQ